MSAGKRTYFVTGIGTDVGKTIISAILVEALKADYWKPVQCGELDFTDTNKVKTLISNNTSVLHPEQYTFSAAMSPHAAAKLEQREILLSAITLPQTENHLVVEGAGGLMVPLNDKELVIDLIEKLDAAVILISMHYLGSINHTLLSVEALQKRNIPIAGIIFNGNENTETEKIIADYTAVKIIGRVDFEKEWNKAVIRKYANQLKSNL